MMKGVARVFASLLTMGAAFEAQTHAFLDHAMPAVGSAIHGSPAQVRLWFTQELEPAFSTVQVQDRNGKRVDKQDKHVDPANPALLPIPVPDTWLLLAAPGLAVMARRPALRAEAAGAAEAIVLLDAVHPGGLGGTYAGNPVACAAAHAVLDAIEEIIRPVARIDRLDGECNAELLRLPGREAQIAHERRAMARASRRLAGAECGATGMTPQAAPRIA